MSDEIAVTNEWTAKLRPCWYRDVVRIPSGLIKSESWHAGYFHGFGQWGDQELGMEPVAIVERMDGSIDTYHFSSCQFTNPVAATMTPTITHKKEATDA